MNPLILRPKLSGRYRMAVRKAIEVDGEIVAGPVVRETPWFDNLITDGGLEELGTLTSGSVLTFCHVGTGSTTPANTDTSLVTFVASTNNQTSNTTSAQSSAPYYGKRVVTYRFGAGAAAGNISEVGISSVAGNTRSIFSRALVLDGGGSPTTITVLSDEFLDVTYELRSYPPCNSDGTPIDVTGTVTINSVSYTYTLRASNVTSAADWANGIGSVPAGASGNAAAFKCFTGAIGAVTTGPSGTLLEGTTWSNLAYSANSLVRQMECVLGLDDAVGNTGAIQFFTTYGTYQIGFSAVIPKTNTQILTWIFQIAWARKTLP